MRNGKDTIYLVQATDAAIGSAGLVIANQTEGTHSYENELTDEQTKFGRVLGYGNNTESIEITCYGETGDPGQKATMDAIKNKKQLKVWEVDLIPNADGTHNSVFAYCLAESVEKSYPAEGFEEISATLQVIGESVEGKMPALPDDVIQFGKYGFETPGEYTGEYPGQTSTSTGTTGS